MRTPDILGKISRKQTYKPNASIWLVNNYNKFETNWIWLWEHAVKGEQQVEIQYTRIMIEQACELLLKYWAFQNNFPKLKIKPRIASS